MKKKSFILLFALSFILISTTCFATNDMGNSIKNTVNEATNVVVDGTSNLMHDVKNGINSAENTVENTISNIGNYMAGGLNSIENTGNDAYTATRTATEDMVNGNGLNNTTWAWVIAVLAIAVIIGMIWYYISQTNDRH